MYWSKQLRFPPVAEVLSCNRFNDLKKYIHFNNNSRRVTNRDDPSYDQYYKVRPFLNILRDACLQLEPKEKVSIDEQMIPYKGKNSLRQYILKKPKKWQENKDISVHKPEATSTARATGFNRPTVGKFITILNKLRRGRLLTVIFVTVMELECQQSISSQRSWQRKATGRLAHLQVQNVEETSL